MRKAFLFISLFTGLSATAQVPTDTTDLRTKINAWIVTNGTKQITAVQVNQLLNGIANLMKANAVDSGYRVADTIFLTRKGFTTVKITLNSGGVGTETDPTVPTVVKSISSSDISNWSGKQNALTQGTGITISSNTISTTNLVAMWNASQLQGRPVLTDAPSTGQVIKWNGSAWAPADDADGGSFTLFNALGGTGDTLVNTEQEIKTLAAGYGILRSVNGTTITHRIDTGSTGLATQYDLSQVSGGGGGATDLDTIRSSTAVTISSSTGSDAVISAVDTSKAGVMIAADKKKLDDLLRVFNVKRYGAKGDGKEKFTASISSSSSTLTCTDCAFTSADVGKVIVVDTAGGSGRPLRTTIAGFTNSTTVTLTAAATATVSAMRVVWGTDDTQPIQNTINAAVAAGGGKVVIPNSIHIINGAPQTSVGGVNPNCQIVIPSPTSSRDTNRVTLIIEGEVGGNYIGNDPFNGISYWPGKKGTILLSTIDGSGTACSVFGSMGPNTAFDNFNYSTITIRHLTILTQINPSGNGPTVGGINAGRISQFIVQDVLVSVDGIVYNEPEPTSDCAGIIMPFVQSETMNSARDIMTLGYPYGFAASEHVDLHNVQPVLCYYGLVGLKNAHAFSASRVEAFWCKNVFHIPNYTLWGITPGYCYFSIPQFDMEGVTSGKWFDYSLFIDDAGDWGRGYLFYHTVNGGFTTSGGNYIHYNPIVNPFRDIMMTGSVNSEPLVVSGDHSSRTTLGVFNTNVAGQGTIYMYDENHNTNGYGGSLYGNSSNADGNIFGLSRANWLHFFSDGISNLGVKFGTLNNTPAVFGTNNTERMRLTNNGNLLIATTTGYGSTYKLQVNGDTYLGGPVAINIGSDASGDMWYRNTVGMVRLPIGASNSIITSTGTAPTWSTIASLSIPPTISVLTFDPDNSTATVSTLNKLPDLAGAGGSKTVTLPSAASNTGKVIELWNTNSDVTNTWSFASAITLPNGTTTTTFANGTYKVLISDGSVWIQKN